MSCSPENFSIGVLFSSKLRNESCFSAVSPVCGWNQWQKCVTPREIAHSLMTCATVGAISMSSFFPSRTDATSLAYTSAGSFARICFAPKVLMPKYDEVGDGRSADAARGLATKRDAMAARAEERGSD